MERRKAGGGRQMDDGWMDGWTDGGLDGWMVAVKETGGT